MYWILIQPSTRAGAIGDMRNQKERFFFAFIGFCVNFLLKKLKPDKISWSCHTWEGNVTELPWAFHSNLVVIAGLPVQGSQWMGSPLPSQGSVMLMTWDCVWWTDKYWLPPGALCFILVTQNHTHGADVSREPSSILFHPDLISQCNILRRSLCPLLTPSHLLILCHSGSILFNIIGDICWDLFLWFPYLNCDGMISLKPLEICAYTQKYIL